MYKKEKSIRQWIDELTISIIGKGHSQAASKDV